MVNHPNRAKAGRPPIPEAERKVRQTVSLSPDVLEACKALGPGWMPQVDAILRKALLG